MWPYLRDRPPRCQRRCWRGLRRLRPAPRRHRAGLSPDAYALLSHLTRTGVSRTAFGPLGQKPHNIAPLFSHTTFPQSWRLPDDRGNSSVGVAKRVRTYNHLGAATYGVFASYLFQGHGGWTAVRRPALTASPVVPGRPSRPGTMIVPAEGAVRIGASRGRSPAERQAQPDAVRGGQEPADDPNQPVRRGSTTGAAGRRSPYPALTCADGECSLTRESPTRLAPH
jgi:hypothetical protein